MLTFQVSLEHISFRVDMNEVAIHRAFRIWVWGPHFKGETVILPFYWLNYVISKAHFYLNTVSSFCNFPSHSTEDTMALIGHIVYLTSQANTRKSQIWTRWGPVHIQANNIISCKICFCLLWNPSLFDGKVLNERMPTFLLGTGLCRWQDPFHLMQRF